MSAYCSKEGFNGASSWFLIQYQEEVAHGMKFFKYLEDQDDLIKGITLNSDLYISKEELELDNKKKLKNR